jgi:hypothetical protein
MARMASAIASPKGQRRSRARLSNRTRQLRWRIRQQEPLRSVYRVEVLRDKLLNKLIDAGLVAEADCWRRDLIEAALSRVLEEFDFPEVNK